jgi:hypothetical protein
MFRQQHHLKNKIVHAAAEAKTGAPTLLDMIDTVQYELANAANVPVNQLPPKRFLKTPEWVQKIGNVFTKTIFKPVLKLKPKRKMDWKNFGKIIGVLDRQKTFFTVDIPRILEEDGMGKMTARQLVKIFPRRDRVKLRQRWIKELNRPVSDDEPWEKLAEDVMAQRIARMDKLKQIALVHVAQQSARNHGKFLAGMALGYKLLFDDRCGLCGDRGRAEIHLELLSSQYEIEKMRRMLPARPLTDLQSYVGQSFKFHPDEHKAKRWFKDVCDKICLSMKGRGRPHKFVKPRTIPA